MCQDQSREKMQRLGEKAEVHQAVERENIIGLEEEREPGGHEARAKKSERRGVERKTPGQGCMNERVVKTENGERELVGRKEKRRR